MSNWSTLGHAQVVTMPLLALNLVLCRELEKAEQVLVLLEKCVS